jgi:hypothetical protein
MDGEVEEGTPDTMDDLVTRTLNCCHCGKGKLFVLVLGYDKH